MAKMTAPEHEEKDRLGDQLHRKEKADEDRYAAERDRELIAKMRAARAAATGKAEVVHGRCPKCDKPLNEEEHDGIKVDACGSCGGVWLERTALESILLEQQERQGWLARYLNRFLRR